MRQRLAAVLAADIADYTRLMGADQAGTLRALQDFRAQTLRPAITSHSGDLIKDMGDGWLVEFTSVSEAVACAMALQDGLAHQSVLGLRIGINIGDVLHENEDIFGDGVNVAARLQTVAPPGGIALSGAAYDILDGTLAPAFSDAGVHELKNVARLIHVWMRVPRLDPTIWPGGNLAPTQKLTRIAIHPATLSVQDQIVSDLGDAITGELLRLLNSSDWIGSRISTVREDEDYNLSTYLRVRGDQVRLEVTFQTPLGDTIWETAFDGTMSGSFTWQDRVSKQMAANVFGAITDSERDRLFEKPSETLSARELLECAVLEFFEVSEDALTSALSYVDRTIVRDASFAPAYVQGVRCLLAAVTVGYRDQVQNWLPRLPAWLDRAEQAAGSMIRLAAYRTIWTYVQTGEPETLRARLEEILDQAPFDPDVLCLSGWAYVWLGTSDRALECFRKFERVGQLNSLNMAMQAGLAIALLQVERDGPAIDCARNILRHTREFAVPFQVLASAAAHLGDLAEAREAASEARRLFPGDTIAALKARTGFLDNAPNDRFFDGLRKAGFPDA